MADYETSNSTADSESLFADRSIPTDNTYEGDCGDGKADFIRFLVNPVPYEYKLKRFRPRKSTHESIVFEVDDSHRFRNCVSLTKSVQSTLQTLSGGRTSTMREYMKARSFEAEIRAQYDRLIKEDAAEDVRYPVDVVQWEEEVDEMVGEAEALYEGVSGRGAESSATEQTAGGAAADGAYDEIDQLLDERWDEVVESSAVAGADEREDDGWVDADADAARLGARQADEADGWDHASAKENLSGAARSDADRDNAVALASTSSSVQIKEYVNNLLADAWEENIFYDEDTLTRNYMTLYVDDPNLIFERVEEKKKNKGKRKGQAERAVRNKYNISNDKYYSLEGKKVSLGTFGVQHCAVALRLDERFYKANLTKEELKNFHRPPLRLGQTEYVLGPASDRKQDAGRGAAEITLADQSKFRVVEYFEDEPPFVVNPGMVSLFNKYYRTSDAGDEPCPAGCIALEHGEDAPFFGYGDIGPGSVVQTLGNNLFIAPVVGHQQTGTYLCVLDGHRIVVRPVESVMLAGQELPKEEVFAPHSRKLNQFCKDRLKVAAHRAFAKGDSLLMSDLDQMFPYFSEGSKRKWLKEYADCIKKGRDNIWMLREPHSVMCEEDIRKLVTPEEMCQYESMLACELRMQELGLRCTEDGDEETASYTPSWVLTRNFVNAANGRGLLQLSARRSRGKLDSRLASPGLFSSDEMESILFSFRRVRFRKGNEAENRKILAEHQASYKERVDRIWAKQLEFLSLAKAPEFSAPEPESSAPEHAKAPPRRAPASGQPLLTIRRTYVENGKTVQRTEELYDPRLVKAYLKAKSKTPEDKKGSLTCSNCGQSGHMKTNKTCPKYVSAARSTKKKFETEKRRARIVLQDLMNKLLSRFMAIPFSNAFHRPVSTKKFPNYPLIVRNPVDFSTMRARVRAFAYKRFSAFVEDFKMMLDNCILYNGPTHSLTEIAESIYQQALEYADENRALIDEAEEVLQENDS
ncbi:transcription initiation factor TFIID subunit 1 [Pancytospora philotis]|nr:transcription initiation factor TFIID subunit 1 [Pancytospora philotis]